MDRLHYEKDPCVKYDLQRKLWIYLHKNRPLDYPQWNENKTKLESTNKDILKDNSNSLINNKEINQELELKEDLDDSVNDSNFTGSIGN